LTENQQLLACLLLVFAFEVFEYFVTREDDAAIFRPNLSRRIFYWFAITVSLLNLISFRPGTQPNPRSMPEWFVALFFLVLVFARPNTLSVGPTGLTSYSLYGLRKTYVPWGDVLSVNSDWQQGSRGLARVFMGYRVVVTGRDGKKVIHSIGNSRQGEFLNQLRQHVAPTAFAPGLFDWHP
jgi:hypothetical protein